MPRPQLTDSEIVSFCDAACHTALEIVAQSGIDALTVRELGKRMGCSYAKPYRYFGDKQRLIDKVRAHAFDQFAAFMSGDDPDADGVPLFSRYLHFASTRPAAFEMMFGFRQSYVSVETRAAEDRAWRVCTQPFYDMAEKGESDADPETLAHIVWVSLHGLSALTLSSQLTHGMDEQAISVALLKMFAPAIAADPE